MEKILIDLFAWAIVYDDRDIVVEFLNRGGVPAPITKNDLDLSISYREYLTIRKEVDIENRYQPMETEDEWWEAAIDFALDFNRYEIVEMLIQCSGYFTEKIIKHHRLVRKLWPYFPHDFLVATIRKFPIDLVEEIYDQLPRVSNELLFAAKGVYVVGIVNRMSMEHIYRDVIQTYRYGPKHRLSNKLIRLIHANKNEEAIDRIESFDIHSRPFFLDLCVVFDNLELFKRLLVNCPLKTYGRYEYAEYIVQYDDRDLNFNDYFYLFDNNIPFNVARVGANVVYYMIDRGFWDPDHIRLNQVDKTIAHRLRERYISMRERYADIDALDSQHDWEAALGILDYPEYTYF